MSYPNTYDDAEELALLPNWAGGVQSTISYKTSSIEALSGYTQNVRQWSRPRNAWTITRDTTSDSDNEKLSFNRIAQAFKPLRMPLWGHSTEVRLPQTIEGEIFCDIGVPAEIAIGSRIYVYDYRIGAAWRTVTDIQTQRTRLILEEDLTAPLFPSGAWVFPTAVGTLSLESGARTLTQTRASMERLSFNEI